MGYCSSQEGNYLHLDIPFIFQTGPKRRNTSQLGDSEPGQEGDYIMNTIAYPVLCGMVGLVIMYILLTVFWHWKTNRPESSTAHDDGFHMPQIRPPTRTEILDTPRVDDGSLPREIPSTYDSWAANADLE